MKDFGASTPTRPAAKQYAARTTTVLLYGLSAIGLLSLLPGHINIIKPRSASPLKDAAPFDPYPDTDLPMRAASEPWDISVDFPYTKRLHRNITEATWVRITAHPKRDEIVFDILGDLYCMHVPSTGTTGLIDETTALPILQGIPYEKEASFSPSGDELVFISDATFGVDNIWSMPYTSCKEMAARSVKDKIRPTMIQHTNSTFRTFGSPAFHPTEPKFIATKWYLTVRPNGGGEIWEVPMNVHNKTSLPERGGERVIERPLPRGWPASKYNQNQVGPEQARYAGVRGDGIVYSRNTVDLDGVSEYSKDVHKGINSIFLLNTTTGMTTKLVDAQPGGANMPRLSHDGKTMAFVRRYKEKEVLAVQDVASGTLHYLWYELNYDVSLIMAPMGQYPSYSFNHDDSSIIIWASGQIHQIPLKFNHLGERVLASEPRVLPFRAEIDIQLADTRISETDIRKVELADEARIYAFRGLRSNHDGSRVVFEAAGATYTQDIGSTSASKRIPRLDDTAMYHAASFVQGAEELIVQARWSDLNLTTLELSNPSEGKVWVVAGMPRGRYLSPVIAGGRIAFLRTGVDYMMGEVQDTAGGGVWVGDISLPTSKSSKAVVSNLVRLSEKQNQDIKIEFHNNAKHLFVNEIMSITSFDLQKGPDSLGHFSSSVVQTGKTTMEMVLSPGNAWVGVKDHQHTWVSPAASPDQAVWSKPGDAPKGLRRLSVHGGHDVMFSGDGKKVFWLEGPQLKSLKLNKLSECDSAAAHDPVNFGASCTTSLASSLELNVTFEGEVARLREAGGIAFVNATIYPMDGPRDDRTVIRNGTVVVKDGVIVSVGANVAVPDGYETRDVKGAMITPGLVDVHGHWGGFLSLYPAASWELETFLGYGVTTIHNPSSKNVGGYVERNLVERGAIYGPRIYHTGDVLYGSTQSAVYTEINSYEDARSALIRIKAEGGPSSFSTKNYQLAARSARQRLLLAAREMDFLIYPEGGFAFDWDLTYLIDGMTTIEHPIPIAQLYDDVLSLYEASGSSYTQVAAMNYGGIFAKQWVWQNRFIPEDKKLHQYVKHVFLDTLAEVKQAPINSYHVFNTSISTKKLADRGIRTNIGSHGEQPIGLLFHSEMDFLKQGGQTPFEVLWAATIGGAESLGLQSAVGSLKVGKMADLLIYPEGVETLEDWWRDTTDMEYVMRGGRLFTVREGLEEDWPNKGARKAKGRVNPQQEETF